MVGIHPQNPAVQQAQTGKDSYRFLSSLFCHILFEGFGNWLEFFAVWYTRGVFSQCLDNSGWGIHSTETLAKVKFIRSKWQCHWNLRGNWECLRDEHSVIVLEGLQPYQLLTRDRVSLLTPLRISRCCRLPFELWNMNLKPQDAKGHEKESCFFSRVLLTPWN